MQIWRPEVTIFQPHPPGDPIPPTTCHIDHVILSPQLWKPTWKCTGTRVHTLTHVHTLSLTEGALLQWLTKSQKQHSLFKQKRQKKTTNIPWMLLQSPQWCLYMETSKPGGQLDSSCWIETLNKHNLRTRYGDKMLLKIWQLKQFFRCCTPSAPDLYKVNRNPHFFISFTSFLLTPLKLMTLLKVVPQTMELSAQKLRHPPSTHTHKHTDRQGDRRTNTAIGQEVDCGQETLKTIQSKLLWVNLEFLSTKSGVQGWRTNTTFSL